MKNFKTDKTKEWYILTPANAHGFISKTSRGLFYNEINDIETFDNEEDYLAKINELGLVIDELI